MQWSSAKRKSSLNGNFILMLGLFLAISFHSVFKQEMISFLPLHIGKIKYDRLIICNKMHWFLEVLNSNKLFWWHCLIFVNENLNFPTCSLDQAPNPKLRILKFVFMKQTFWSILIFKAKVATIIH